MTEVHDCVKEWREYSSIMIEFAAFIMKASNAVNNFPSRVGRADFRGRWHGSSWFA